MSSSGPLLDMLMYRRDVLVKRIEGYKRVREAVSELFQKFTGDVYALEALSTVDRTLLDYIESLRQTLTSLEKQIELARRALSQHS